MPIITAQHLEKSFRRPKRVEGPFSGVRSFFSREHEITHAVQDVSFNVEEGELIGYLGSNGAGKSTTIKMLAGILVPTSGMVEVAGLVPWQQRERNALNIGVVFGQRTQLWWDLPLIDSMRIVAKLYGVDDTRFRSTLGRLSEQLELDRFLQTPVRQLSLGQRMRGDLAAAMLYEPRILFLDEPTIGLDVVARERLRQFVETTNREQRTTIMLTTHDLADVERLCRRIVFIDRGRVLYDGPIDELKRRYAPYRELHVTLAPGEEERQPLTLPPGVEVICDEPSRLDLRFDPQLIAVTDVIARVIASRSVSDLAIVEPELERVVREIEESGEVRT